jgi:hypothetical protein
MVDTAVFGYNVQSALFAGSRRDRFVLCSSTSTMVSGIMKPVLLGVAATLIQGALAAVAPWGKCEFALVLLLRGNTNLCN